jgi:hypothetical protein
VDVYVGDKKKGLKKKIKRKEGRKEGEGECHQE